SVSPWVNGWCGCNAADKPGKTGTYSDERGRHERTTEDRTDRPTPGQPAADKPAGGHLSRRLGPVLRRGQDGTPDGDARTDARAAGRSRVQRISGRNAGQAAEHRR